MTTSRGVLYLWAYVVEIVAASLLLCAVVAWFGVGTISAIIDAAGTGVASQFATVMLAGSFGMTWTFYAKADTDFARWLVEKGAFDVYAHALVTSVGVYAALLFSLLVAVSTNSQWIDLFAAWLSVLGAINVYTMLKNVLDLMKLTAKFNERQRSRNK